MFDLPPTIQVADRKIEESHERGYVTLSVADILAQSSNVGAVKIGLEVGSDRFDHWIRQLGFGEPTGVQLPAEEQDRARGRGLLGLDDGNLPIGQGLSVTPMQMAAAYAAIDGRPAPSTARPRGGRRGGRARGGHQGDQRADRGAPPAHARGRVAPGGTAWRSRSPATGSRARPAPPRRPSRAATGVRLRRVVRRLRARGEPGPSSRSSSWTSRGAATTAARSQRAFGEIAALPYLGIPTG